MKKAQLNLIDKAVAFLNPQGAVNRIIARQKLVNFSYDAVKYSRERKGPSALSGAEDYRSNYDRVELMKRARDLAENVGLVRSILMKFASHTAANISYQARTENPEVNTEVEAYWAEWWDKCDISTRHTGSTLMQVAMMSMLRDGDFLFVLVRDKDGNLKIQGIEADRLGDPFKVYTSLDLIGGIHIDRDSGAPTAYDIYNRSIGDFYTYQATISSSQAFHLFDPLRIDQYRGVSAFHTAINDATDIYDIINFEKMAAKNASSQAGIVKRNNNNASDLSNLTNDEDLNGNTIKLEAIESGKISYLEPGEDIVFPDGPSRPSGAFAEFHKILLRNICLGVGIPYSFAVDPSSMSGPTARLEMQQAGRTFRRYQKLLDDKVLRPIKNIVIADAVARGLIENNSGSRTTKGIFNFGANVSIDLGRESQANLAEFRAGLMTASQIYSERGLDFESSMRQRAIEAKLIKDLAQKYGVAPETISDIVPPTPPPPQGGFPTNPDQPTPTGGGNSLKKNELAELDCGTGSGGFQPGNSCAGGGGIQSSIRDATPSGFGPSTSSQEKTKEQRMRGESIDDAINRKVGYQVDNGSVKINEDKGGWVVSVAQPEGNPRKFRSSSRQQAINQAYEELYPDTELIPHPSDSGAKPQKKSNLEILESLDCGTGSGGFKEGNTCAGGEGGDKTEGSTESQKFPLYKEAKTREEAEEIGRSYSKEISYRGMSTEHANITNKEISDYVGSTKGALRLKEVKSLKFNGVTLRMREGAVASYKDLTGFDSDGAIYINTAILGDSKKWNEYQKASVDAEKLVRSKLNTLPPEKKQLAEKMLSYKRQLVDDTPQGIIRHELGHHFDYNFLMKNHKEERVRILDNKPKYEKGLSYRASENNAEYIAESFSAYRRKEKIDPDLEAIFNRYKK